jgi:endoglycosylceramidase
VIGSIESEDRRHLVFVEPDIYSARGRPNLLGPMPYPRLVLSFHSYCGARSPVTGDPTDVDACAEQQLGTFLRRRAERPAMAGRAQPGGPAWFLGEFGATQNADLIGRLTSYADALHLGWAYWSWKYYDDPTGSSDEALASPAGELGTAATALSRTYAQAVAGTPIVSSFDPATGAFHLAYVAAPRVTAPTVIFVAAGHYPDGYCALVTGGGIVSPPRARRLLVEPTRSNGQVYVSVLPGRCPYGV